jgi:hypothetical protein
MIGMWKEQRKMRLTNDESEVDNKLGRRIKWEEEEEE